jgi:pilus assembly protein Flp/PilA
MIRLFSALIRSEDGATLVEYALVVTLIAVICVLAISKIGTSTASSINKAALSI